MPNTLIQITCEISAIPWGEARTADDVVRLHKGTCTGKHLLMQQRLDEAGIVYRPVVCTFLWSKQGIALPENLTAILREGEWHHGHNFLQVKNSNDEWIDVDATWDPALKACGFLTLPADWNGEESFVGMRKIEERWDGVSIGEKKQELIGALDSDQQERRERFLKGFIAWIDSLR